MHTLSLWAGARELIFLKEMEMLPGWPTISQEIQGLGRPNRIIILHVAFPAILTHSPARMYCRWLQYVLQCSDIKIKFESDFRIKLL